MNNLVLVCILKCLSGLADKIGNVLHWKQFVITALLQPVDKWAFATVWHNDVDHCHAIDIFFSIAKEGEYVWMIEAGNSFGLALEEAYNILCGAVVRVRSCFDAANFDGNLLVDTGIFRQVNFAHAAASKEAQKTVLAESQSF